MNNKKDLFLSELVLTIESKELSRLLLSNKRNKESDLKNIIITIVHLKKGYFLNFVYRHNTKDITKNYTEAEGIELIKQALDNDFLNADLYSKKQDISLIINPNGKTLVKVKNADSGSCESLNFSHDKTKDRLIKTADNIYLRELGIVNADWELRREMSDKYKQINKYIELLKPYLTDLLFAKGCHIADMGSGKGYLTFALYDYITNTLKKDVKMTGVEYRKDLVDTCNSIAEKSHFENLHFIQGSIEAVKLDHVDILIALHACDTATDDAIYKGIMSGSSLIVCAPCCHKQIRKELNPEKPLNHITQYGILKERQAEMLTDTLRAMLMEANGYKTHIFEFIATEHTPKNVMIVGEKRTSGNIDKQQILNDIASLKQLYGIQKHYLEVLLEK